MAIEGGRANNNNKVTGELWIKKIKRAAEVSYTNAVLYAGA
jgi:hypothetical protein